MNDIKSEFSFTEIPDCYKSLKEDIYDNKLGNLYSKFNFIYFHQVIDENLETFLYDFLSDFKFITYKTEPSLPNQTNDNFTSILCFEGYCLLIESVNINSFHHIIEKINSSVIDLNSAQKNSEEINREITSFHNFFEKEIKTNEFVKLTIEPIAAYVIRRYFYPSNFFKDQSFFSFRKNTQKNDKNDFTKFDHQKMSDKVKNDKKENDQKYQYDEFKEEEFILLRPINSNSYASFNLVLHVKTLYVFMMKTILNNNNQNSVSYEINFCKQYSHRCLTHFYGFVMKKQEIIGFIYEFMSNGNLYKYITNKKDEIDEFFSYNTMVRIAEGINFLHSNSFIHRDIKPLNILIDHDYVAYLSDFDTVKSIEMSTDITHDIGSIKYMSPEQYYGHNYSFPVDVFAFGLIIYFLYEKKNLNDDYENFVEKLKNIEKLKVRNISQSIQIIFKKCISLNDKDRPPIKEIIDFLKNEIGSFYYLEPPFYIKKIIEKVNKPEIQQYFKEIYYLLFISSESDDNYIKHNQIQLYQIINLMNQAEISNIIYSVGKLYYDGQIVEKNYKKCKAYFEISAEMNNSDAIFNLGKLYNMGQGVEQNYSKAREYYERASKMNNSNAMNNLAVLYKNGLGVIKDVKKAQEYFELSAKQNNPIAYFNIGLNYFGGIGVEQDYLKAKYYFEISAKNNHSNGYVFLGTMYQGGYGIEQDFQKAKYYFESAAKLNNSDAFVQLGLLYSLGQGVKQDFNKSIEYFELAAKQGNPIGLCNLGDLYYNGEGVKKDYEKAQEYFELAAKQNYYLAHFHLGIVYKDGYEIPKDYIKAKNYFEMSAKVGFTPALYELGKLYFKGKGVDKNITEALNCFTQSAKDNYEKALFKMGMLYKNGQYVDKDIDKARKYFESAALEKNSKAIYQLGILHFKTQNYVKAREYFEMSAQKNDFNSVYYLGLMHENGLGVERNIPKAIEYYNQCSVKRKTKSFIEVTPINVYDEKVVYNNYYYQSNNDLGLIYILEKEHENIDLAEKHLKEAGFNEYQISQNNYGLYCQFYLHKLDNAEYFYQKASKNHFALSEFNLGYIREEEGKYEEAMEHYQKASEYENEPIIFHKQIIEDNRLEISKSFIICYTNLKIWQYNQSNIFILRVIFDPLFDLLFYTKSNSYSFNFKTKSNRNDCIITNLKDFIFNNPLFNINQNNFSSDAQNASSFGWKVIQPISDDKIELKLIIRTNEPENKLIKNRINKYNKNENDNKNFEKNSNEYKEPANDKKEKHFHLDKKETFVTHFKTEIDNIFNFMNSKNDFEKEEEGMESENGNGNDSSIEVMKIKMRGYNTTRYLKYPKKLNEIIINTFEKNKEEINEIIDEIKTLLYKEPYSILFGRIGIHCQEKPKQDITAEFYKGIGLDNGID